MVLGVPSRCSGAQKPHYCTPCFPQPIRQARLLLGLCRGLARDYRGALAALKDALRARPRDFALLRFSGVFREARMHKPFDV